MTKPDVIRELQEMARAHWMMARAPTTWDSERPDHERQAAILEAAIDLLEASL